MSIEKKHLVPKLNRVANVAAILVKMKYSNMFFYFIVSVIIIVKCCTKIVLLLFQKLIDAEMQEAVTLIFNYISFSIYFLYCFFKIFSFILTIAKQVVEVNWKFNYNWIFFLYLSQSGLKFQLFYSLRSSCCNCSV